jgi:transcriptional regulator with XRE-family HTH domain
MVWTTSDGRPVDPASERGLKAIGQAVRRRRRQLVLSQRELAVLSGLSQSMISRLETGRLRGLRWRRFARLVDALDGLDFGEPSTRSRWTLSERRARLAADGWDAVDPTAFSAAAPSRGDAADAHHQGVSAGPCARPGPVGAPRADAADMHR